ncbi:hypothetical protein HAZT_HAZT005247 [Hyalella azteca]|uniref:Transcriptional adapter 1 n=1 Tax=Hyalella azteca TaxID=294128 RepID=A0A6A0H5Y6_HYAAZ|nr:hypothetical protein HAZT_HAZT005247 [Hyalella azteca]
MSVTKEHFDSNARDLLKDSDVYLHNEFLLAILTKCQLFSSTPPPSNLVSMSYTSPLSSAAPETCKGTLVHDRSSSSASLAHGSSKVTTSYSLMPDSLTPSAVVPEDIFNTENSNVGSVFKGLQCSSKLRGRLLLAAWDHGLHAATEGVVLLLHHATKQVLQSVLTAVLKKRHGYKVREGRFVHSLGTSPPNPWLRSAASASDWTADSVGIPLKGVGESIGERPLLIPTAEAAQQNGAHLMSYAPAQPPPLGPINCFELYHTLKGWPSLLPCHTVYSLCMERLSNRLSHPDQRAIAQEELVRQEQLYRHQLRQYRIAPSI